MAQDAERRNGGEQLSPTEQFMQAVHEAQAHLALLKAMVKQEEVSADTQAALRAGWEKYLEANRDALLAGGPLPPFDTSYAGVLSAAAARREQAAMRQWAVTVYEARVGVELTGAFKGWRVRARNDPDTGRSILKHVGRTPGEAWYEQGPQVIDGVIHTIDAHGSALVAVGEALYEVQIAKDPDYQVKPVTDLEAQPPATQ